MKFLKPHLTLWCAALLLTACGGGSSGGSGGGGSSQLVANAGTSQTLESGSTVQLDGSGSTASGNNSLNYQWSLVTSPELSQATLSNPALVDPTFVADLPGIYTVELRVTSSNRISEPSRATITATTDRPVAVTATTLNHLVDSWIQLDGSNSLPPTGGDAALLTYEWSLSGPNGAALALDSPSIARPGFSPTVEGIYRATLKVGYEGQTSESVLVLINVSKTNSIPVAKAGGPYTIALGETVTLDGSESTDADGDSLNYRWVLPNNTQPYTDAYSDKKPRGSSAVLPDTDAPTIDFTPDVVGTYKIQLQVFDGTALSPGSEAVVTVTKPDNHTNTAPVAVISEHNPRGTGSQVGEVEVSAWGYAYFYSGSYDNDGDALTYQWEWVSVPEAFKQTPHYQQTWLNTRATSINFLAVTGSYPTFTPIEGFYTIRLTVNDGTLDSNPVEQTIHIRTGANTRPTAVAKADIPALLVGTQAWFDGNDSSDPQDGTLGLTYQWRWVYTPPGSAATLNTPTAARASFTPDLPGPYIAELIVTDNDGASNRPAHGNYTPVTATINAKLTNNPPFARFTDVIIMNGHESKEGVWDNYGITYDEAAGIYTYQLGSIYDRCHKTPSALHYHCVDNFTVRSAGYDVDGDQVFYDMTLSQPQGSTFQPSYTGAYRATFSDGSVDIGRGNVSTGITEPGDYTFTLQASDGSSLSDPQTLTVRVLDYLPDYKVLKVGYLHNGTAGALKGSADGSDLVNNHFLPFYYSGANNGNYEQFRNQGGVMQYLKLTAVGQDYSIENIQTSITKLAGGSYVDFAGSEQFQPEIRDLPSVIPAGETRVFALWVPPLPAQTTSEQRYQLEWRFESPEATVGERQGSFIETMGFVIPASE